MCMGIIKDCKNLEESYGQICVLCNKCGRFDKKILTKDQRIAELENDLENLTAYDLKKSHEYSIKDLIQANENLSKQIAELESEKQKAVKEFADETLEMLNKYSIKGTIKICDNVLKNNIYLLLKEKRVE